MRKWKTIYNKNKLKVWIAVLIVAAVCAFLFAEYSMSVYGGWAVLKPF